MAGEPPKDGLERARRRDAPATIQLVVRCEECGEFTPKRPQHHLNDERLCYTCLSAEAEDDPEWGLPADDDDQW